MSLVTPRKGYKSVPWLFGKEIEIPQEWEVKELGKLLTKIQDGNYGQKYPKPHEFLTEGIPFITSTAIGNNFKIELKKVKYISKEKHKELQKAHVNTNDIIFTNRGANSGQVAITPNMLDDANISPQLTLLRINLTYANYKFIYWYFQTDQIFKQMISYDAGSAMNFFGLEQTKKFKIIVPTLPEQQKIATILSNVDNLIESTGKVITHSKKVKTGLMQKLLTRGIGHVTFKKVPWLFGKEIEIPEEWEIVKLKEISKLQGGYAFKSEDYQEHGIQLLKIANVSHGEFNWNEKSFVPKNYWNEYDDFQIKKGDIILAMTRPIISGGLKIAIFNETKNILLNQRVGKFILQNVNSYFFFCMINQKLVIEQIITKIGESGQPNISSDEVGEIKICYNNNIQEQQKIASILSNIDSKITSQEQYKEKLEKLKKSLMQKLLTGMVRV